MVRSHTITVLATIATVILSMPASVLAVETSSVTQADQPTFKNLGPRATPTTPQIVENVVLVKYVDALIPPTMNLEERTSTLEKLAAVTSKELKSKIIAIYPRSGVVSFKLPPQESVESVIKKLKENLNVQRAHRNYRIYGHAHNTNPPNDQAWLSHFPASGLPMLWGLEMIRMKETWDLSTGGIRGGDIVIAVLDTGIDHNHPDINLNMWPGNGTTFIAPDDNDCSLKPQPSNSIDYDGHGTHVASIVAARGHNDAGRSPATSLVGLNWEAKLMAVKILCNDLLPTGTVEDAVEGIHYAIDHNATVIVGSWGFPAAGLPPDDIEDLRNALARARANNILYVASAGNNYDNLSNIVMYPQHFPFDNIIVVAATDPTDQLWFEKPLTQTSAGSNFGSLVHIAAPGENILGLWPYSTQPSGGYTNVNSGTSLAAPHVAGCAALLQAKRKVTHPTSPLSPVILKDILLTSGDQRKHLQKWTASGRRLNCHKALQELKARFPPSDSTPPATPTNLNMR